MQNIVENNRLIAHFLGFEMYYGNGYQNFIFGEDNHRTDVDLHYDKDWNWLMQVVDKIDKIALDLLVFEKDGENLSQLVFSSLRECNIALTFSRVIEFILWYNNQNK